MSVRDLPEPPAPGRSAAGPVLRGLVIDWGGVLTPSLDTAMHDWALADGVDPDHFREVIGGWIGHPRVGGPAGPGDPPEVAAPRADVAVLEQAPDAGPAGSSPVHRLERGEMSEADFERELAAALRERGSPVDAEGLLRRLLRGLEQLDPAMLDVLRRSRRAGLRTALLSNSWGDHYPAQLWDDLFDAVVISGREGVRKPDVEAFRLAAERLGLRTDECVMVDDLERNVRGAAAAGMVGVRHRSHAETVGELEVLLGVVLRG